MTKNILTNKRKRQNNERQRDTQRDRDRDRETERQADRERERAKLIIRRMQYLVTNFSLFAPKGVAAAAVKYSHNIIFIAWGLSVHVIL